MIPGLIYILCAATSLGCAILLFRGSLRTRNGLLLWSSLCFFAMTANNVLLYSNVVWFPDFDILIMARSATVLGIVLLNIGLIWYAT
jgi:hypothetical protein